MTEAEASAELPHMALDRPIVIKDRRSSPQPRPSLSIHVKQIFQAVNSNIELDANDLEHPGPVTGLKKIWVSARVARLRATPAETGFTRENLPLDLLTI